MWTLIKDGMRLKEFGNKFGSWKHTLHYNEETIITKVFANMTNQTLLTYVFNFDTIGSFKGSQSLSK